MRGSETESEREPGERREESRLVNAGPVLARFASSLSSSILFFFYGSPEKDKIVLSSFLPSFRRFVVGGALGHPSGCG